MDPDYKQRVDEAAAALQNNDLATAKGLYQAILQDKHDATDALFALGTIAYREKDLQAALDYLSKAAQLEPEAVDIAFNYASALATAGNRYGALQQLQRATKHCRDDGYFVPKIADLSIRLGEPAAAIALMSRLQRLLPADQIILANAQGMLGNWQEAVNILQYLHSTLDKDSVVAEKLSAAAAKLRDFPTAIKAYESYLKLVKPTANDYLRFADLLLIAQEPTRSEKAIDIALDMGSDGVEVYILKARIERLKGNYTAVNEAINEALQRQPNNGQAWSVRAEFAREDELPELVSQLQIELADESGLQALNHWQRALLEYSQACMQDKLGDYAAASRSLEAANAIQYAELVRTDTYYNAEAAELEVTETMQRFNAETIIGVAATIDKETTAKQPIFILGMPRSGTTLIERIIGQNTKVYCAGEQEAMEFVSVHFKHQQKIGRLPATEEISAAQWGELRSLYLEKLPKFTQPIFTDKLPHNFRNVGLILKMFPEAKIIQLHRDPRDVCLSIYERAFSAGHNYANRWEDLEHFHRLANRLMTHWSTMARNQIIDIQYESLVENSEATAKQLIKFLGFQWDASYLEFHESTHRSFTFSEMQVREPISGKRIGRWKNYAEHIPALANLTID